MTFTTNKTTTKLNHLEPRAHEKNCVCGTCYVCAVRCTVHMICPPCPRLRHHLEQVARHAVVDDQVSRRPGALEERRLTCPPCPRLRRRPEHEGEHERCPLRQTRMSNTSLLFSVLQFVFLFLTVPLPCSSIVLRASSSVSFWNCCPAVRSCVSTSHHGQLDLLRIEALVIQIGQVVCFFVSSPAESLVLPSVLP